jgi:hypothetical protein
LGRPGTAPTGVPIDLVWGLVLLSFGIAMLALARRARRPRRTTPSLTPSMGRA